MDELACLMDWDLQAIGRGCGSEAPSTVMDNPHLSFSHFCSEQDDLLYNFHHFSETTTVLDELEELYKPFYPVLHPLSAQTTVTSSLTPVAEETDEVKVLKPSDKATVQDLQDPAVSKCKRSKKKQKNRVVKEVRAVDGICDGWAWRKYGQKQIKGSPYPRSYYRCSSSKGCLARRQVERSHLDPEVFIVSYTAEHSHPHPTRRSGSTRKNHSSPNSKAVLVVSPRTPLVTGQSIEDELVLSVEQIKGLKKGEDFADLLEEDEGDHHDLFPSMELEELNQQLALDGYGFMDTCADTWWSLNESKAACRAS